MGRKEKPAVAAKANSTAPNMLEVSARSRGAVNTDQKTPLASTKKTNKNTKFAIRRSGRLQNKVSSTQDQATDIIADPINVESENEDEKRAEQSASDSDSKSESDSDSEPTLAERNLEQKVDYLVQYVDELKSKAQTKAAFEPQYTDLNYRSLYIESQKKVDALREENRQLVNKLEFALGKIEGYDRMRDIMKDTILFSGLGKATEAMLNFSSRTAIGRSCSPDTTPVATENAAALGVSTEDGAEPKPTRSKRKKN